VLAPDPARPDLALRVLADRLEHGEIATAPVSLSFVAA
jgi:hypothetical protein